MTARRMAIVGAVASLLASGVAAGCATGGVSVAVALLPADALPSSLLGDLTVEPSDVVDQVEGREGLLTATGLWRVLEDGELVATVQVADTVAGVDDLEPLLVAQFGATAPRAMRVGSQVIHVASGSGRTDTLALLGDQLLVVQADNGFTRRRALVRQLLELLSQGGST